MSKTGNPSPAALALGTSDSFRDYKEDENLFYKAMKVVVVVMMIVLEILKVKTLLELRLIIIIIIICPFYSRMPFSWDKILQEVEKRTSLLLR